MTTPAQHKYAQQNQPPEQQQQPSPPPPVQVQLPHIPTPEEEAYIQACGQAIEQGAVSATEAATAGDSQKYLQFAQGVDQLTIALIALKTGGKSSGKPQPGGIGGMA